LQPAPHAAPILSTDEIRRPYRDESAGLSESATRRTRAGGEVRQSIMVALAPPRRKTKNPELG
jgi:hypothetical protein